MSKKSTKTVRFTSRDGWRLTATIAPNKDGQFYIWSIGKQASEGRPLDFAPFHVMDAVLGQKQFFDNMDEAIAHAKAL